MCFCFYFEEPKQQKKKQRSKAALQVCNGLTVVDVDADVNVAAGQSHAKFTQIGADKAKEETQRRRRRR